MSSSPGRNDPCSCGSGAKNKRCCVPREPARRAAALKQQTLWAGDSGHGGEIEDDDGFDNVEVQPIDYRTIESIRHERGFVTKLDDILSGEELRATEWKAPSIRRRSSGRWSAKTPRPSMAPGGTRRPVTPFRSTPAISSSATS